MKKWFAMLLWVVGPGAIAPTGVRWYSIDEAVRLAAEEPRIIVVDVYNDWCGWCKRMDATTFYL